MTVPIGNIPPPTPEQKRAMGYSADAPVAYLSEYAWIAFCAWVNIAPGNMPPHMRWKPKETAEAWERVAYKVTGAYATF